MVVPTSLQRLALSTTLQSQLAGNPQVIPWPSPCGPNCSYSFQFEGPSLKCSSTFDNETLEESNTDGFSVFEIYSSRWQLSPNYFIDPFNQDFLQFYMNFSTWTNPQSLNGINNTGTRTNTFCFAWRSQYRVENIYINNVQKLSYVMEPIAELNPTNHLSMNVTGTLGGKDFDSSLANFAGMLWTVESLEWYRDCQFLGIISGFATMVNGSILGADSSSSLDIGFDYKADVYANTATGSGGNILPFTILNSDSSSYTPQNYEITQHVSVNLEFNVTEAALNKLLGDLMMSIIPAYGIWNETANTTQNINHNVYTFSKPMNLILPYFLSLLLILPFLIIGTCSLLENGVPASDGGFIQILTATTGSPTLQQAAAANCLGGNVNRPEHLTNLKIQYGELVDRRIEVMGKVIRRAGFGTRDEVVPLDKGKEYGAVVKSNKSVLAKKHSAILEV